MVSSYVCVVNSCFCSRFFERWIMWLLIFLCVCYRTLKFFSFWFFFSPFNCQRVTFPFFLTFFFSPRSIAFQRSPAQMSCTFQTLPYSQALIYRNIFFNIFTIGGESFSFSSSFRATAGLPLVPSFLACSFSSDWPFFLQRLAVGAWAIAS